MCTFKLSRKEAEMFLVRLLTIFIVDDIAETNQESECEVLNFG